MAKKCAVTVCDSPGGSKGCCSKHYQRFLKLKLLDGLQTVTPQQADDFNRRWEAEREANPRMAAGAKGGGSGSRIEVRLETTRDPVAPPDPVREVAVPAIKAAHKGKAPTPPKAPPKPLPAPVSPDLRAMDDALLEAVKRERDALSAKAMRLSREVEKIKQDMGSVEGALDAVNRDRDDLRAKVAAQAEEIERLSADARGFAHDGATAARTLNAMRLTAMLRASEPLRLAFADALNDHALQALRRAARNPDFSETLAAELMDVQEVG